MTTDTADLALDFSHSAMEPPALSDAYRPNDPRDPWLARRRFAWGGSEMPALMLAYGLAPIGEDFPAWLLENATHYKRLGIPKIIAWKAGLRAEPKGDETTKNIGKARERELLARYRDGAAKHRVDPKSIRHADNVPQEFFPLPDRTGAPIAVTPDAWARANHTRELVAIELKTTFYPLVTPRPKWHHAIQLEAEIACMSASFGIVVIGECWNDDTGRRPPMPVRAFPVAPNADLIALERTVATEAWQTVERIRAVAAEVDALGDAQTVAARRARKAAAESCAALWAESVDRMRVYRDAATAEVESTLSEIDGLDELTNFAA